MQMTEAYSLVIDDLAEYNAEANFFDDEAAFRYDPRLNDYYKNQLKKAKAKKKPDDKSAKVASNAERVKEMLKKKLSDKAEKLKVS